MRCLSAGSSGPSRSFVRKYDVSTNMDAILDVFPVVTDCGLDPVVAKRLLMVL